MKERKFEVLDVGNEITVVSVDGNAGLRGLLKFDKSVREILREIRKDGMKLEEQRFHPLGRR